MHLLLKSVGNPPKKEPKLSVSEVITLMILFHHSGYTMKGFYKNYVKVHMRHLFPKTVSYNRYVELMESANPAIGYVCKTSCMGSSTGISFMDSTPLRVCKNKRISRNNVFNGVAALGKSILGFFFGFKLHLVVNDKGELLNFMLTAGNVNDRQQLMDPAFIKAFTGKLYADKGYISAELTNALFCDGIHLVTQIRNNLKNCLMELKDMILRRK